jgi:hypothetical protein
MEEKYFCEITVPDKDFSQAVVREIGFYGLPEKVKLAKEAISDRVVSQPAQYLRLLN